MEPLSPFDPRPTASVCAHGAVYLNEEQRRQIARDRRSWHWRTEWPTWLLIAAVYGGWFGIASNATRIGLPVAIPLLAVASAWYMSLQHELLHGHPTRSPTLNALLGFAPLAVWFPYAVYRQTHLAHHATSALTDPDTAPESFFVSSRDLSSASSAIRMLLHARATFIGRVSIGPAVTLVLTGHDAYRRVMGGDRRTLVTWIAHALAVAVLAAWLELRCGVPPWAFFASGYLALSIALVRSFQEHRYHPDPACRSVINHVAWPWRLLFLNNTLHAVHHDLPSVPWFALPKVYRDHAATYDARNAGFVVRGYREWWQRFAFVAADYVAYSREASHGAARRDDDSAEPSRCAAQALPIPSDLIGAPLP